MHQRQLFLLLFLQQRPIRLHQQIGYFGEPLLNTYLNRKKVSKNQSMSMYIEIRLRQIWSLVRAGICAVLFITWAYPVLLFEGLGLKFL